MLRIVHPFAHLLMTTFSHMTIPSDKTMATERIIHQQKGVNVSADPLRSCLTIQWTGFVSTEDYRTVMDKALAAAEQLRLTIWLTDARAMEVVTQDNITWTVEDWQPRWLSSSIQHALVIEPEKIFGKLSFQKMLNRKVIRGLKMQFFLDPRKAQTAIAKLQQSGQDQ